MRHTARKDSRNKFFMNIVALYIVTRLSYVYFTEN